MFAKRNIQQIKNDALLFSSCINLNDLQTKLSILKNEIILQGFQKQYYRFTVRKVNGGERTIESPSDSLKLLQRKLNYYLQAVYFLNQSSASYGYIISPKGKKSNKNIVKNAEQHLSCRYMLNVDFKNFFHQITQEDVAAIFTSPLFKFNKQTAQSLSKVCAFKKRLPMGAPTSPIISNLFTITLDQQLNNWAQTNSFTYTRFVDDLTFSSKTKEITPQHFSEIQHIAHANKLVFNTTKTKFLKVEHPKIVTGLLLQETVDIHPDFYKNLEEDLIRLKRIFESSVILKNLEQNTLLKTFKQEVFGQINFIRTVEGINSTIYQSYLNKYKQALTITEEVLSKRWIHFSYH